MVKVLVPRPFTKLPAPTQTYPKGYRMPTSAAQVPLLAALGYDASKYGTPQRALISPDYDRTLFVGPVKGQAGLIGAGGDLVWEPTFTECQFTVERVPDTHKDEAKWGEMPYGFVNPKYVRCHWYSVWKEHLTYPHGLFGATYEDCCFENGGGQAVQVSERYAHHGGHECWSPKAFLMPGLITMRGCWVNNVGKVNNGRVSECLTFFGPQDEEGKAPPFSAVGVRLEGCGIYYRTSGGGSALFQRRPYFELVPDPRNGRRGQILYLETGDDGAKPLVFSEGSQRGLIEGWTIDGGKCDVLDMPDGQLVLKDVAGKAVLRVGKTQVVKGVKKAVYKTIGTFDSLRNATI